MSFSKGLAGIGSLAGGGCAVAVPFSVMSENNISENLESFGQISSSTGGAPSRQQM